MSGKAGKEPGQPEAAAAALDHRFWAVVMRLLRWGVLWALGCLGHVHQLCVGTFSLEKSFQLHGRVSALTRPLNKPRCHIQSAASRPVVEADGGRFPPAMQSTPFTTRINGESR